MSGVATAIAVGTVGAAVISSQATKSAAQTQANAANQATEANQQALAQQMEMTAPWRTKGEIALNQLSEMTQPGGELTKGFSYDPFNYKQNTDPGYAFRFNEGMKALNATAAARGGLVSGNALKGATDYGQALGSQEYQNAFNRYLSNYANAQNTFQLNRNNLVQPLEFLSGQGQASATNTASNIGATAQANAANTIGAANATAAGQIGQANAWTNALGTGINAYQTQQMINNMNKSAYQTPTTTPAP